MHAGAADDKTRQALMLHRGSLGRRGKKERHHREKEDRSKISAFGGFP